LSIHIQCELNKEIASACLFDGHKVLIA
jgi:hypothetical protein